MKYFFCFLLVAATYTSMAQNFLTDSLPACHFDEGPLYLIVDDQFDANEIDRDFWIPQHGHLRGYNMVKQMNLPEKIEVDNGILKIWAKKDSATGPCQSGVAHGIPWDAPITLPYTGGELHSRTPYLYGKFEARIKCPKGKQLWPAFWIYSGGGDKRNYCELDILEAWGTTHANCTVHDFSGSRSPHTMRPVKYQHFKFDKWQTYTLLWTPYKIQFYLDHELVAQVFHFSNQKSGKPIECGTNLADSLVNERIWPFPNPSTIILNMAINGNLPGDVDQFLPAALEVDYVRIWQRIPDFVITGLKSIPLNNVEPRLYKVPYVEGATYLWDYPANWKGSSNGNQLEVLPDSLHGGNLSVILTFKDDQQLVKDINVTRSEE